MSRLKQLLRNLRGSFWFVPSLIVAGSIVLAVSDDLPSRSGLEASAHGVRDRFRGSSQIAWYNPLWG